MKYGKSRSSKLIFSIFSNIIYFNEFSSIKVFSILSSLRLVKFLIVRGSFFMELLDNVNPSKLTKLPKLSGISCNLFPCKHNIDSFSS